LVALTASTFCPSRSGTTAEKWIGLAPVVDAGTPLTDTEPPLRAVTLPVTVIVDCRVSEPGAGEVVVITGAVFSMLSVTLPTALFPALSVATPSTT